MARSRGPCLGRLPSSTSSVTGWPSRWTCTVTTSPGAWPWMRGRRRPSGSCDAPAVDGDDDVAGLRCRRARRGRPGGPCARLAPSPVRRRGAAGHTPRYGRSIVWPCLRRGTTCADGVGRDREADADVAVAGLPAVAICELTPITRAAGVEQRAAGVAGVDRRVGLDDLVDLEAVGRADVAAEAGDDAGGRGAVEAERVADRDRRVADLHAGSSRRARAGRRSACRRPRSSGRRGRTDGSMPRTEASMLRPFGPKRTATWRERPDDVGVRDERPVAVEEEAGAGRAARADGDDGRAGRARRSRRSACGPAAPGRAGLRRGLVVVRAGRPRRRPRRAGARSPSRRRTARGRAGCAAARARAAATAGLGAAGRVRRLVVAVRAPVAGPQVLRALHATASAGVRRGWVMSGPPQVYPSVGRKLVRCR